MLTERERSRIEAAVSEYETRSAAAVEAMRIVQEERGWVSDESLADIGEVLGLSTHALDSLATFYSLIFRRPVGRHVIQVCTSVCCWMEGAEEVVGYLQEQLGIGLGGTTADGRFTLLPIVCLGACAEAPAMLVDGQLHSRLTPESIRAVLTSSP